MVGEKSKWKIHVSPPASRPSLLYSCTRYFHIPSRSIIGWCQLATYGHNLPAAPAVWGCCNIPLADARNHATAHVFVKNKCFSGGFYVDQVQILEIRSQACHNILLCFIGLVIFPSHTLPSHVSVSQPRIRCELLSSDWRASPGPAHPSIPRSIPRSWLAEPRHVTASRHLIGPQHPRSSFISTPIGPGHHTGSSSRHSGHRSFPNFLSLLFFFIILDHCVKLSLTRLF